jgi:hypothetical protein
MNWIRPLLFAAILLAVGATSLCAYQADTFYVRDGITELEFEGITVRVESTGDVIVQLSLVDGVVVGQVSAAPGTYSASVLIVVADDPDRIIFQGRVVAPIWFTDYLPQETGRGEQ